MGSPRQIFKIQIAQETHPPWGSIQTRPEKENNKISVKALTDASLEICAKPKAGFPKKLVFPSRSLLFTFPKSQVRWEGPEMLKVSIFSALFTSGHLY